MSDDAYTAAWLAEMWPTVREESRHHREEKRKRDRELQRVLVSSGLSTDCAESDHSHALKLSVPAGKMVTPTKSTPGSIARTTDESRGLAS